MGTGASSYTPPPSPYRSNGLVDQLQATGLLFRSIHNASKGGNVAPVIIRNCREEYQHVTDIQEPIVLGRIADKMPKHFLVKGQYFLVRDPVMTSDPSGLQRPIYEPKTGNCFPVYSAAQPTARGLERMVQTLIADGHKEVLIFNIREEPVLFLKRGEDFLPYTIKRKADLTKCIVTGKLVKEADLFEASIRKEVIELATLNDDNKYCFYNKLEPLTGEPHVYPLMVEDELLVSEEVYSRIAFANNKVRYRRLCFPLDGAPSDLEVDHFICIIKNSIGCDVITPPAMLFTCQTGCGRSTLAMVMGYLVTASVQKSVLTYCGSERNEETNKYERGDYNAVRKLVTILEQGESLRQEVDLAIDECSSLYHIRSEILKSKKRLEQTQTGHDDHHSPLASEAEVTSLYRQCVEDLSRYFFLICFNAYLHDQTDKLYIKSFITWMQRHPEVNRLRSNLSLSLYDTTHHLLQSRQHCLVSDFYVGLDLLGSQQDVRVPNFRKINIKTIPVYGMAQPANDGLNKVVNHLLGNKVRHTHIVLVNLRNDIAVECDGSTYTVRDSSNMEEPINFPGSSRTELEDKEDNLKKIIRSHKHFQLYDDIADPPMDLEIRNCYSILDLADKQRLQTLDMSYYRVPLIAESNPVETDIDDLMELICGHCKQERLKNNSDTAFVFFCRTGKSRTTFAMAVAGLTLCHLRGFPKGTAPDEQERISVPNAKYTKGEFIIVEKLVRMLPRGQHVKREVDFILDEIFNTMTPMMFHLRETIFVTYNKIKKAKCQFEEQQLRCLSIIYLERYIYLILFNAYLHGEKEDKWKRKFSQWMKEVGGRAGVYELLDNLHFYDFDSCVSDLRFMTNRWKLQIPMLPFHGEFR